MKCNLSLYKLELSETDNLYFENIDQQRLFFDNISDSKFIPNISYNGERALRIQGFNWSQLFGHWSYCRLEFDTFSLFAFVDFGWVNDTSCEMFLTFDYYQNNIQFMKFAQSTVQQRTVSNSEFNAYIPYSNKMTVTDYQTTLPLVHIEGDNGYNAYHGQLAEGVAYKGGAVSKPITLGWILLNLDPNVESNIPSIYQSRHVDNGVSASCTVLALPLEYDTELQQFNTSNYTFIDSAGVAQPLATANMLNQIYSKLGANIIGVGMKFSRLAMGSGGGYQISPASRQLLVDYNIHSVIDIEGVDGGIFLLRRNRKITAPEYTIDLTQFLESEEALNRNPYLILKLGNFNESIEINLLDFKRSTATERTDNVLRLKMYTSCVYPFLTSIEMTFGGQTISNRDMVYNLTETINVPYEVSAWTEYFTRNKQYATEGLSTQQEYERQALGVSSAFNILGGGLQSATGMATAPLSQAGNATVRGATGITGSLLNTASSFATTAIEQRKARAMQTIQFNDIKTAPTTVNNTGANLGTLSALYCPCMYLTVYKARNIEQIRAYHKRFGYQVQRVENMEIKKHKVFDYIQTLDCTLDMALSRSISDNIERMFNGGIRLWYDYATFLNYNIPNTEA